MDLNGHQQTGADFALSEGIRSSLRSKGSPKSDLPGFKRIQALTFQRMILKHRITRARHLGGKLVRPGNSRLTFMSVSEKISRANSYQEQLPSAVA